MGENTLEEVFTGEKIDVGHFNILCCPVYTHVPKEKRKNMDPSINKGKFVGYRKSSEAYRVYCLGQRHIEINRAITFHKEVTFKCSK